MYTCVITHIVVAAVARPAKCYTFTFASGGRARARARSRTVNKQLAPVQQVKQ